MIELVARERELFDFLLKHSYYKIIEEKSSMCLIFLSEPIGRSKAFYFLHKKLRPLKNAQFCSSSRKAIILTTGIHGVF